MLSTTMLFSQQLKKLRQVVTKRTGKGIYKTALIHTADIPDEPLKIFTNYKTFA